MTRWRDPNVLAAEYFGLIKLIHVLGGVYIWEFFSNIGFEYSVISGKRKFTRTFPLYLGCRLCPLFAVITQFVGINVSHEINCRAWVVMSFIFGYISFGFASTLIILRVIALWNWNKGVVAFASVSWLTSAGTYLYSAVTSDAVWAGNSCIALHVAHGKISIICTFISDLVLLGLMLVGLLRWKNRPQRHGIWWFLCTQGLVWVVLVTLAEVPPTVFILLDLNDPLDLLFQPVALIIMAIGASRLYRGLADYPALQHPSAKAAAGREGPNGPQSIPITPIHKDGPTGGKHISGESLLIPNGQSFLVSDLEVAKGQNGDID